MPQGFRAQRCGVRCWKQRIAEWAPCSPGSANQAYLRSSGDKTWGKQHVLCGLNTIPGTVAGCACAKCLSSTPQLSAHSLMLHAYSLLLQEAQKAHAHATTSAEDPPVELMGNRHHHHRKE